MTADVGGTASPTEIAGYAAELAVGCSDHVAIESLRASAGYASEPLVRAWFIRRTAVVKRSGFFGPNDRACDLLHAAADGLL